MMLDAPAEALNWADIGTQFVQYIGNFAVYGAIGARIAAPRIGSAMSPASGRLADWGSRAGAHAASIGIGGALIQLAGLVLNAVQRADSQHTSVVALIAGAHAPGARPGPPLLMPLVLIATALVGFVLARARVRVGWWVAAAALLIMVLAPLPQGQWARLINPLHILAGGLWLGTLAVLVIAVFPLLLRGDAVGRDPDLRPGGSRLDAVVRRFSRLALVSSGLLVTTGVITAWRHLGSIDALWTTPYGWALDVKLLIVAGIAALGFYNWRYATPALSAGSGDARLARSSLREVSLGVLVLIVTSVLVSLPAPAEREAHTSPAGAGGPGSAPAPAKAPGATHAAADGHDAGDASH